MTKTFLQNGKIPFANQQRSHNFTIQMSIGINGNWYFIQRNIWQPGIIKDFDFRSIQ